MKRSASQKKGEEGKKQRTMSEFIVPSSPAASMPSPPSPAASMPSPPSPSTSIESPSSQSISINMCFWCEPPSSFNSTSARENHERQCHTEEKGFYELSTLADRSETKALFQKYLPVFPEWMQTQTTDLGIYLKNEKGQMVGAFHMVVSATSVSPEKSAQIRAKHRNLFLVSGYAQAHIIPGSSARDLPSMYELSFNPMNFEPLNPKANSFVGGKIEDYCQQLQKRGWKVCVFVLLDKTNILGTVASSNRDLYPISSRWSYLIFMERGDEHFYQAFTFPNGEPTKSYPGYRTTINEIRSLSGLDFKFHMNESISQYWGRIKKEKHESENPYVCTRSDMACYKRFPNITSLKAHERYHDPVYRNQVKESNHKRHSAQRTSVDPSSTTSADSS